MWQTLCFMLEAGVTQTGTAWWAFRPWERSVMFPVIARLCDHRKVDRGLQRALGTHLSLLPQTGAREHRGRLPGGRDV